MNSRHSKFKFVILSLLLATGGVLIPAPSRADTSSLYLTPASVSQATGGSFTIYVGVNANGNAINAIEATVNLPSVLAITGAGTGGSLCSIWVQQPAISGSSVSFKCGIPGGTTASGNLISISLQAKTVGSGSASITGARVLAGPGQDVTGGTSGGTYTVTAAPTGGGSSGAKSSTGSKSSGGGSAAGTAAPVIASTTHPDQNKWYTNNNPAFSWAKVSGASGYTYSFDQSPDTMASQTSQVDSATTSAGFSGVADGVWYLHVQASGTGGSSPLASFRVQIDKTAPTGLTIVTEPKLVADKRPMVSFTAVDATSGVDHYDIRLDNGAFTTVASPYTPKTITSGQHTFTVRAYDKAGNMVEGKAKITIKNIPAPKITRPGDHSTIKLLNKLEIGGTAGITTTVDLYIDGKSIARGVKVASSGDWSYTYRNLLLPGKHTLSARAVKDGIESSSSQTVAFTIDPAAISLLGATFPVYVVILILLIVIAALIGLVIWLFITSRRQYRQLRDRFAKQAHKTEGIVEHNLNGLQTDLRHDIHTLSPAKLKSPKDKRQLEDQIAGQVTTTEGAITQDIEDDLNRHS